MLTYISKWKRALGKKQIQRKASFEIKCSRILHLDGKVPTPENVAEYDLLLLVTDHMKFDYQMFKENAQLIVDTRGVYQEKSMNIVKA